MKPRTISVADAAGNFAECVNRVRYQGIRSFGSEMACRCLGSRHFGQVPGLKIVTPK
jgi:hypothetical protein